MSPHDLRNAWLAALALALAGASAGACGPRSGASGGHTGPGGAAARHGIDGELAAAGEPPVGDGDPAALCDVFSTLDLALRYDDPSCAGPVVIAVDHDPDAPRLIELNVPTHDLALEHLETVRFVPSGCAAELVWTGEGATLKLAIAADSPATLTGRGLFERTGAGACQTKVSLSGDWATW